MLVAGEQKHVTIAGALNLDDLHILRDFLQLVVDFVVDIVMLVVEVKAVVDVTDPNIVIAVLHHGDYLSRGNVGLLPATRHEGRELATVERAEPVPSAEPYEAVLVFQRAIHSVAGQSFFQRVMLHNHAVLGMKGHEKCQHE